MLKERIVECLKKNEVVHEEFKLGASFGHFLVERDGLKAVPFDGENGIESLLEYLTRGDWEGLYEDLDRVSCKFCALKNLREIRNIYWKMPDVWNELRDYQTRTYFPYKGDGKSVFDLEVRFELEREFECQGKSIRNREFFDELKKRLS